ncbi:YtcA family lipoprotein [Gluconobacter wancherniae]|uniref:YtcA family lipoprotein n=1 Tax=Gluconobacter wancherniae TaxID=1307955 RepID=UPI0030A869AC
MHLPRTLRHQAPSVLLLVAGGCSLHGAPAFSIAGAYFPGWMICALIGVGVAVGLRVAFVLAGIDAVLSLRLFTYTSLGVMAALLSWLLCFGP